MELFGHQSSTIPLSSFHICLSENVKFPPYRYGTFYLFVKQSSKLHRTVQKFSIFSSKQRQSPIQKTSKSYRTVRELLIFFLTNLQKSTIPLAVANLFFQKKVKIPPYRYGTFYFQKIFQNPPCRYAEFNFFSRKTTVRRTNPTVPLRFVKF